MNNNGNQPQCSSEGDVYRYGTGFQEELSLSLGITVKYLVGHMIHQEAK